MDQSEPPPTALEPRAVPLNGADLRMAANMAASLAVPTATSFREVDAARLVAERARFNAALAPRKLAYTHFLAYAVAQAAATHPGVAAHYEERDGTPFRIEPTGIALGLAVDVAKADGSRLLLVPVLRGADGLDFADFTAAYDDLVARARELRLKPDEMAGPDLTLTNPGSLGTYASVPRLMPGQGTIVATGALRDAAGAARIMLSSTYDHRIISGAASALFLATLEEYLGGADGFYEDAAAALGVPPTAPAITLIEEAGAMITAPATPDDQTTGAVSRRDVAAATELLDAWRAYGHRAALLDPLGSPPPGDPELGPASHGLDAAKLGAIDASAFPAGLAGPSAGSVLANLTRVYGGSIAYEFEHLGRHEERAWLREAVESDAYRAPLDTATKLALLGALTDAEAFEQFLGRAFVGQTRFSIEGLDALLPLLGELADQAADAGIARLEVGMAHRGRLNVLAHLVGIPYASLIDDFRADRDEPETGGQPSDVRYHRGAEGVHQTARGPIEVAVLPNPSHLEAIDPVLLGSVRAQQTDLTTPDGTRNQSHALAVMVHGDASFAGQGVVAETFNMARLRGYTVGGAIHVIANNQLGFTTDPGDARSTDYASDLAKGYDVPIAHVNADDPEAALAAARLAFAYKARFGADFVIDLVGYRRHGHNEGDEPGYTQPLMYAAIAGHSSVRALYAGSLEAAGVINPGDADRMLAAATAKLAAAAEAEVPGAPWEEPLDATRPATIAPVSQDDLLALDISVHALPDGFTLNPKLADQMARRQALLPADKGIAWAHAEALSLASLLTAGVPVRLSGQDTARGTFSQRHLVLHDVRTGAAHTPLAHLPDAKAAFEVIDSPLSEYACLGFEYGFAVAAPDSLVCWEAQFGDFQNGAEIIIDQFIIAGRAKWGQESRLTLLLPHGYEGQGPEHSSARLERFLALGAEGNIRVAVPSTPAQYFHLLRDQASRPERRPLVLLTPKSLLRSPAATSAAKDLVEGSFTAVLDDQKVKSADVRRLVLSSGKVHYDLAAAPRPEGVALARVEMLYPFPTAEVERLLARHKGLKELVWAQEEPYNMGARKFIMPELMRLAGPGVEVTSVSRPDRASPAEGRMGGHLAEQARIVSEALGG